MSTESLYTFVGGCADGERKRVPDSMLYVEFVPGPSYPLVSGIRCWSQKWDILERHTYRKHFWHHTTGAVTVRVAYFIWDGITEADALIKLIEGYKQYPR